MKSNQRRGRSGDAVAKVTLHGATSHPAQLFERARLGGDIVTESCCNIATIGLVLSYFEYQLAHS